jgi:hypothetical protein
MKLVTVAKIRLNRPGSIGSGAVQRVVRNDMSDGSKTLCVVVEGDNVGDVRKAVQKAAVEHGENASDAERLTVSTPYDAGNGIIWFNEGSSALGTQYGSTYAETEVFPALEIEGRYFRLSEVEIRG